MPKILPTLDQVTWPRQEGALGVVGVAPFATIDFLDAFYRLFDVEKDWQFPRVICDLNTKIPSRGRYFELGETNPCPAIAQTIHELAQAGAAAVVVPCNTAHILYSEWAQNSPVLVPNIIDASVNMAARQQATRIAVAGSNQITKSNIYGAALEAEGLSPEALTSLENSIFSDAISQVKQTGSISPENVTRLQDLGDGLVNRKVDCIILACTELSKAISIFDDIDLTVVDSNQALAHAAKDAIFKPS